jgi:hypothetical protein
MENSNFNFTEFVLLDDGEVLKVHKNRASKYMFMLGCSDNKFNIECHICNIKEMLET